MNRAFDWLRHFRSGKSDGNGWTPSTEVAPNAGESVTVLGIGLAGTERDALQVVATAQNWRQSHVASVADAQQMLCHGSFGIVLLDRDACGNDWRKPMERIAQLAPRCCIVLLSAVNDEFLWREVVQHGGFDVLSKPLREEQLRRGVEHAWLFRKSCASQPL